MVKDHGLSIDLIFDQYLLSRVRAENRYGFKESRKKRTFVDSNCDLPGDGWW